MTYKKHVCGKCSQADRAVRIGTPLLDQGKATASSNGNNRWPRTGTATDMGRYRAVQGTAGPQPNKPSQP
jgi:hypothetical protein